MRTLVALAIIFALHACSANRVWATISVETIALSGTDGALGPGLPAGEKFVAVAGFPVLNALGEVSFFGEVTGGNLGSQTGLWLHRGNANVPYALTGQSGLLGPNLGDGVAYSRVSSGSQPPALNDQGVATFGASIAGIGVNDFNDFGHWQNARSDNQVFSRAGTSGDLGPGLGAETVNSGFLGLPHLNQDARVVQLTILDGPGVSDANNLAVLQHSGLVNSIIARTGDDGATGPGLGTGVVFTTHFFVATSNAAENSIAFSNIARGPEPSGNDRPGLWRHKDGTNLPFALADSSGNLGPGLVGPETFSTFHFPSGNNLGENIFYGTLDDQSQGVWINSDGRNTPIALSGRSDALGPGLGPGIRFAEFPQSRGTVPLINSDGLALFQGALAGSGQRGLWLNSDGRNIPIAIAGDTGEFGPGVGAGVMFTEFGSRTVMNSAGHIAFRALIGPPSTVLNRTENQGLWAYVNGHLELIARSGQQFDVDSGIGTDLRTVRAVDMSSGFLANSGYAALKDSGELAFFVLFTDGTTGIFVAHLVPEPTSGTLLVAAISMLGRRRRVRS